MFKKILVPTDGSKLSQKALEQALAIAKLSGGTIVVLHVYPKFSGSPYGAFGPAEDVLAQAHVRHHQAAGEKLFAAIERQAREAGVALETMLVESDDVHTEIIGASQKKKCDLICMASHGHRGIAGVILGSETQKVLVHGTVPVLVLR